MTTSQHTIGPWHIGMKPGPIIYGPKGEQVCDCRGMLPVEEIKGNARLIAAAPDLLSALEQIEAVCNGYVANEPAQHAGRIARQAIAKAQGKN